MFDLLVTLKLNFLTSTDPGRQIDKSLFSMKRAKVNSFFLRTSFIFRFHKNKLISEYFYTLNEILEIITNR
jgi:hypothetical protein